MVLTLGRNTIICLLVLVLAGLFSSCGKQENDLPIVFTHRGLHHNYPDNTLEAFRESINNGYKNIEMDVVFSKDHQPYILHDEWLEPMFGIGMWVDSVSSETLDTILIDQKYHIPKLVEVFENIYPNCESIMLDVKGIPDSIDLLNFIETFKKYDTGKSIVLSTENEILKKLSAAIPKNQLGTDGWVCADALSEAIDKGYGWWFVDIIRANQNYITLAKNSKIKTAVYTINTEEQLKKAMSLKAEVILTDEPEMVR